MNISHDSITIHIWRTQCRIIVYCHQPCSKPFRSSYPLLYWLRKCIFPDTRVGSSILTPSSWPGYWTGGLIRFQFTLHSLQRCSRRPQSVLPVMIRWAHILLTLETADIHTQTHTLKSKFWPVYFDRFWYSFLKEMNKQSKNVMESNTIDSEQALSWIDRIFVDCYQDYRR